MSMNKYLRRGIYGLIVIGAASLPVYCATSSKASRERLKEDIDLSIKETTYSAGEMTLKSLANGQIKTKRQKQMYQSLEDAMDDLDNEIDKIRHKRKMEERRQRRRQK